MDATIMNREGIEVDMADWSWGQKENFLITLLLICYFIIYMLMFSRANAVWQIKASIAWNVVYTISTV
jgi:hypothetical protein